MKHFPKKNFKKYGLEMSFFCKGALFRGMGGPPVLEKLARHLPRQGRGFVRPPICPTPPIISSSYGGASGGPLTDCWHQMNSYLQYILFPLEMSFVLLIFQTHFSLCWETISEVKLVLDRDAVFFKVLKLASKSLPARSQLFWRPK